MDQENHNRLVVGTFNCQMQLTQHRTLTVTGHVYSDDTPDQVNARIDLCQDALDRQFIRCDMVNKIAQREATLGAIDQQVEQLEELKIAQAAAQGNGEKRPKLTSQQLEIVKRGDETVRGAKKNVAMLDSMIAAAQKKLQPKPPA